MNLIPALVIGLVTYITAFGLNRISPEDRRWFNRLRRPNWLTFEWAIPFIWLFIFTCGAISAYKIWQIMGNTTYTWLLMAIYFLWEVAVLAYTPVMCRLRSLQIGTIIGAVGFTISLILFFLVLPISNKAAFLIIPHLLWSPIGTFVTWQMQDINRDN